MLWCSGACIRAGNDTIALIEAARDDGPGYGGRIEVRADGPRDIETIGRIVHALRDIQTSLPFEEWVLDGEHAVRVEAAACALPQVQTKANAVVDRAPFAQLAETVERIAPAIEHRHRDDWSEPLLEHALEAPRRRVDGDVPAASNTGLRGLQPPPPPRRTRPRVYISYKHDVHPDVVRRVVSWLREHFEVVIDTDSIEYKDSIAEFVNALGEGDAVVALISEGYLYSAWCMRDLLSISQHRDWRQRIFPIFFPDTPIFRLADRARLSLHWRTEFDAVRAEVGRGAILGDEDQAEYNRMLAFATKVSTITHAIQDMNVFATSTLDDASFETLRDKLTERFESLGHDLTSTND